MSLYLFLVLERILIGIDVVNHMVNQFSVLDISFHSFIISVEAVLSNKEYSLVSLGSIETCDFSLPYLLTVVFTFPDLSNTNLFFFVQL